MSARVHRFCEKSCAGRLKAICQSDLQHSTTCLIEEAGAHYGWLLAPSATAGLHSLSRSPQKWWGARQVGSATGHQVFAAPLAER